MKPRRFALALLAGVLAGLAGCAVGPDYHPPQSETPAGFDAGAGAGIPPPAAQPAEQQRWWTALADPELDSLVDRAMQANFDLAIALARLNEARSFRYVVAADRWPTASFSGAAARSSGNNATRGRLDSAPERRHRHHPGVKEITQAAGFDASWELDLFGRVRPRGRGRRRRQPGRRRGPQPGSAHRGRGCRQGLRPPARHAAPPGNRPAERRRVSSARWTWCAAAWPSF